VPPPDLTPAEGVGVGVVTTFELDEPPPHPPRANANAVSASHKCHCIRPTISVSVADGNLHPRVTRQHRAGDNEIGMDSTRGSYKC